MNSILSLTIESMLDFFFFLKPSKRSVVKAFKICFQNFSLWERFWPNLSCQSPCLADEEKYWESRRISSKARPPPDPADPKKPDQPGKVNEPEHCSRYLVIHHCNIQTNSATLNFYISALNIIQPTTFLFLPKIKQKKLILERSNQGRARIPTLWTHKPTENQDTQNVTAQLPGKCHCLAVIWYYAFHFYKEPMYGTASWKHASPGEEKMEREREKETLKNIHCPYNTLNQTF